MRDWDDGEVWGVGEKEGAETELSMKMRKDCLINKFNEKKK